jgi:hypothetical protein
MERVSRIIKCIPTSRCCLFFYRTVLEEFPTGPFSVKLKSCLCINKKEPSLCYVIIISVSVEILYRNLSAQYLQMNYDLNN